MLMCDWCEIKLGDVFDVKAGGDLQESFFSLSQSETTPYPIYSNSLNDNGLYGYTSNPRYPMNCVTITGRGEIGHAEYRETPFDAIVRLLVLIPKNEVDCKYITYYINHQVKFAIESTGVPQLPAPRIKKLKIKIPKIVSEQTAIASILSKVDDAIEATQNSIKAAEKLKKALMQNLLTGKLKPDGTWRMEDEYYVDEKYGKVPLGWSVKRLNDVFIVNEESLPSKTEPSYKFKYIAIESVSTEFIDFKSCPEFEFKDSPGRARRIIKDGDILISGVRPNLKAFAIYNNPDAGNWICSTGFYVLTVKENQDSNFYFYQILSENGAKQFHSYVAGSNYPAIGDRDIKNMRFLSPDFEEQKLISAKFDLISKENDKQINKIQTLQRLKKSLMQNLLTGKIRVDVEKINELLNTKN